MAYRNKTYVCFDADSDIKYYRLMQAWKQNDNTSFNFYDAHDINNIWANSHEDTIKQKLRDRMDNSKVFIVLVGEKTKNLYKYVRWEIELALKMELPIIVVNLNGKRVMDVDRCPPILINELALHISYNQKIIELALENWPQSHKSYKRDGQKCDYYFLDTVYQKLL